jgi:hypothetical protein
MKNPNLPTVYSIGFIGQGRYTSKNNGKINKIYDIWIGMLKRCYSEKFHIKQSTYKNCIVDGRWYNFQVFGDWFEENYREGFELDKDILKKGNKIYSPETCCFVPREINSLMLSCNKMRGIYPIGVSKTGNGKFKASYRARGKQITIGRYNNTKEAFEAYKEAKENYIKEVTEEYKNKITEACYQALINYKVEITD